MTVRVLVVDDSGFFRRRIVEIVNADPDLEVVGEAADGQQAIDRARELRPDVITMDIEMPVMDGITAVRRIMAVDPTPILMFSSLTHDGAKATLDALAAGATDFMPKRFQDISANRDEVIREFLQKVKAIARRRPRPAAASERRAAPRPGTPRARPAPLKLFGYQVVVIGASTGGPVALQTVLTQLPADFSVPILIVQHMPGTFTRAFAERLNQFCKIAVKEAEDAEPLKAGTAYIAPGGKQMRVLRNGVGGRIQIAESDPGLVYKPSVDVMFESIAQFSRGKVLALVLTGMGADGCAGARRLKEFGATVWAQDEASCVVYGMPAAIANAGLADEVMSIQEIGRSLAQST